MCLITLAMVSLVGGSCGTLSGQCTDHSSHALWEKRELGQANALTGGTDTCPLGSPWKYQAWLKSRTGWLISASMCTAIYLILNYSSCVVLLALLTLTWPGIRNDFATLQFGVFDEIEECGYVYETDVVSWWVKGQVYVIIAPPLHQVLLFFNSTPINPNCCAVTTD